MINELTLLIQASVISFFTLIALRIGEKALNAWLCVVAILLNLFVLKEIKVFGLTVTATDGLAVGYMLGLNLIQEFYGRKAARVHVALAFMCALGFTAISLIHLGFVPAPTDSHATFYVSILSPMPRLLLASFTSFVTVQLLDIHFFSWLRKKMGGKILWGRVGISLILSQILDTLIFSFLGLYGIVSHLGEVIFLSLVIKVVVIGFSVPYVGLSKRLAPYARATSEI